MKIAFIGTHGVGKTTLCFDLAARLKKRDLSVEMVREVARFCPLPINQGATLPAQSWIFHTQIAEEIAAEAKAGYVVCDRGIIDNYCYLLQTGHEEHLERAARHWVGTYGMLFKVPIVGALSFDGVRDMDRGFQRRIDEMLDRLLSEWNVPHHRLAPERRESWADDALAVLADRLPPVQTSLFSEEKGAAE